MSSELRQYFWHLKTRAPGLSYGILTVMLGLAIFVQLRLVTIQMTDRHTMTANYRASIAFHGKNDIPFVLKQAIITQTFQLGPISESERKMRADDQSVWDSVASFPIPAEKIQPTMNILYHIANRQGFIYYTHLE